MHFFIHFWKKKTKSFSFVECQIYWSKLTVDTERNTLLCIAYAYTNCACVRMCVSVYGKCCSYWREFCCISTKHLTYTHSRAACICIVLRKKNRHRERQSTQMSLYSASSEFDISPHSENARGRWLELDARCASNIHSVLLELCEFCKRA